MRALGRRIPPHLDAGADRVELAEGAVPTPRRGERLVDLRPAGDAVGAQRDLDHVAGELAHRAPCRKLRHVPDVGEGARPSGELVPAVGEDESHDAVGHVAAVLHLGRDRGRGLAGEVDRLTSFRSASRSATSDVMPPCGLNAVSSAPSSLLSYGLVPVSYDRVSRSRSSKRLSCFRPQPALPGCRDATNPDIEGLSCRVRKLPQHDPRRHSSQGADL